MTDATQAERVRRMWSGNLADVLACIRCQQLNGTYRGEEIGQMLIDWEGLKVGDYVILSGMDGKTCTIERAMPPEEIERQALSGSLCTTVCTCIAFPLSHVRIAMTADRLAAPTPPAEPPAAGEERIVNQRAEITRLLAEAEGARARESWLTKDAMEQRARAVDLTAQLATLSAKLDAAESERDAALAANVKLLEALSELIEVIKTTPSGFLSIVSDGESHKALQNARCTLAESTVQQ